MYRDLKFAASDGVCERLSAVGPESFNTACTRLMDGLFVTVELMTLSAILGLIIAIGIAYLRLEKIPVLGTILNGYIYIFRGTPLLVQLWFVYFGIGSFGQDGLGVLWILFGDAWNVGLLVLTLNTAAYIAEILRGGLENLPKGQGEAAAAIAMPNHLIFRRILLPQAMKIAWPAYGNELILMLKGSALISTITVMDLMGQTRTQFSRSFDLEIYVWAALLYLLLTAIITLLHHGFGQMLEGKPFFRFRWLTRSVGKSST